MEEVQRTKHFHLQFLSVPRAGLIDSCHQQLMQFVFNNKQDSFSLILPDSNDAKRPWTNDSSSLDRELFYRLGDNFIEAFWILVVLVQKQIVDLRFCKSLSDRTDHRLGHFRWKSCVDDFPRQKSCIASEKMNLFASNMDDLQKISSKNTVVKMASWVENFQCTWSLVERTRRFVTKLDQMLEKNCHKLCIVGSNWL